MTSWTMREPIVWSRGEDWHRANRHLIEDRRQWFGVDEHLNPLWKTRFRAYVIGGWFVVVPLLLLWGFISGPHGMIPISLVKLTVYFGLFPGTCLVWFYAWDVRRLYNGLRWRLWLEDGALAYEASARWGSIIASPQRWSVRLDQIARVEMGATADWQATRRVLLWERPVPREEAQVFLFMADGSRRVIATAHDGRESLSALAQSIRTFVQTMRELTDRDAGGGLPASEAGEGFRV